MHVIIAGIVVFGLLCGAIGFRFGVRKYPYARSTDELSLFLENGGMYKVISRYGKDHDNYISILRGGKRIRLKFLITSFPLPEGIFKYKDGMLHASNEPTLLRA